MAEKATGSVQVGAGFSSIDSLVGFFNITESDFDIMDWKHGLRGGGERFNVNVQYGTLRKDASVSWTNPYLFGKKLSFGVDVFYHDLNYLSTYYDQQMYGVTFTLRKPLGEHSYAELAYTPQQVKIKITDDTASQTLRNEVGSFFENKVDLSFVNDTRDNVFLTRSGHKISVGGDLVAGDVSVYGLHAQGSQYFALPFDMILSFDGALNTVKATSGGSVPIFERLFLGGANDLRGFKYRFVGPKDTQDEPMGGTTSIYGSAEITFPIIEKVRGAFFYDFGRVTGGPGTLGGGWNSDFGLGIRLYMLPTGPIKLDFGIPIQADSYNNSGGHFNFNIGYKF